ncbi:MAG: AAA-like domain-containing protein [Cyanobacteria bacterium J06627_28]
MSEPIEPANKSANTSADESINQSANKPVNESASKPVVFTMGGDVQASGGTYLTRTADEDLLDLCQRGEYAYVLTSRQMGKSSLMRETANQLKQNGVKAAVVDLQRLGSDTPTAEAWYQGFLELLVRKLRLRIKVSDWWQTHGHLGPTQRLGLFFERVVLERFDSRVVVFVDEIDTTLKLNFTDDFFIAIRSLYTERGENAALNRLSFVLVGVATPSDLIQDIRRTPFNIGHQIDLTDFTFEEALPFAAGLKVGKQQQNTVLQWVLDWTGGHPYLTQRVCAEIAQQPSAEWTEAEIEALVAGLFFGDRRHKDGHLKFVQERLTGLNADDLKYQKAVLATYREIWKGRTAVLDEEQSTLKSQLKLSGVVKRVGSQLVVRNLIYQTVFDQRWIKEKWPEESWWVKLKPAMVPIAATLGAAIVMGVLFVRAENQARLARAAQQSALEGQQEAEVQRNLAEERLAQVDAQRAQAETERNRAQRAQDDAKEQQAIAEDRLREVEQARAQTEEQRQQAVIAQLGESDQRDRAEVGEAEAKRQAEVAREQQRLAEAATVAEVRSRRQAETQALNAGVQADSLTVENLLAADLSWPAIRAALALGQQVQALSGESYAFADESRQKQQQQQAEISLDESVRLQAVSTLQKLYYQTGYLFSNRLVGHTDRVTSVSFSPDGETIASASNDGTVRLWDKRGQETLRLEHPDQVTSVSFSPDGEIIASVGIDTAVKLWDRNGRNIQTIEHDSWMTTVSFSPDGETLAIAQNDKVQLWRIEDAQEILTLNYRQEGINGVSFSPDGETLAIAQRHEIKLLTKEGQLLTTFAAHSQRVNSVSFSPDGETIISAGEDGFVRLWDTNGQELSSFVGATDRLGYSNEDFEASFLPDGQSIISTSNGTVTLWDKRGQALQTLVGGSRVSVSPDAKSIAAVAQDATITLWHRQQQEQQTLAGHASQANSVSFFSGGESIVSLDQNDAVRLWDLNGAQQQALIGYSNRVKSVIASPDSQSLALLRIDGTVQLQNLNSQDSLTISEESAHEESAHEESDYEESAHIESVSFSLDGERLATGSLDGTISLWNLNGQKLKTFVGHSSYVYDVSFSPDGQLLTSASEDGTVKLWDLNGQALQTFIGHSGGVNSVSFSPDGETVASASEDGTVKLWTLSGQALQTFIGHSDGVNDVSFSPEGKVIASASKDGTVKLWDLNGQELQTLANGSVEVTSVQFSPDGTVLVSTNLGDRSYNSNVIIWNFDVDDLMNKTCHWLRNYMTNPTTSEADRALCYGNTSDGNVGDGNVDAEALSGDSDSAGSGAFGIVSRTLQFLSGIF